MERASPTAALIRRDSATQRLADAVPGGVTLVCAPAGSGKTMLLRSWIETAGLHDGLAWVSVERDEQDAQRFWLTLIDALANVYDVVQRVDPAPGFHGEAVVDELLAALALADQNGVLVIDDLHELRSDDARAWLERFLTRRPAVLRVVLATREDPRLGLHRLRLAGQLTELRAPDLRFSPEEASEMLEAAGVSLSPAGAALLYERTEGWAAGLRLATISLAHHPDPERFVREFSGSERTVADYLLAEVLERQPTPVRDLLLRTSTLERVNGSLADRLTGGLGSERILQELEDANAFVTSEDASRTWFRYHHLFADLLRLELRRVEPNLVGPLHRLAAEWFQEHGDVVAAVRHAQAARDWPQAIRLLFESRVALTLDGRLDTVRTLLKGFPAERAAADPELAITLAAVRLHDGLLDEAEAYLDVAARQAATVPPERGQLHELQLSSSRLELARRRGDLSAALDAMESLEAALSVHAQPELAYARDIRALALLTLGATELWSMRLDDACHHLDAGLALARRISRPYLEIGCLAHLAIAAPLGGSSASAALDLAQQAAALAEEHGLATDPVAALAFAVAGGSLAWLGRFDEAERAIDRAEGALHPEGDPGSELAVWHARAMLRAGQGRLDDALASLRSAEEMQGLLAGEHALTADVRCEIVFTHVRLGDTRAARAQLATPHMPERDHAEARLGLAAIALAEGDPELATQTLAPVIDRSVPALVGDWAAIYAFLFDAAARDRMGDRPGAEESLERALDLAEPDGLMLPFLVAPVGELLDRYPRHRSAHGALLATIADVRSGAAPKPQPAGGPLLDELSDAELRVVRYLPSNLRAHEIASELLISTNTVRTHLRHIYAKLDAHGRAEAVSRARELGLLAPSFRR